MNARIMAIHQRRAALVARAVAQRGEVRAMIAVWERTIDVIDRVANVLQRLRASPLAIPVAASVLFWLKRRQWMRAGHFLTAWRIFSFLRRRADLR